MKTHYSALHSNHIARALVLLALALPATASAQSPTPASSEVTATQRETARGWVVEGRKLFAQKDYGAALERHMAETLLESLEITPEPTLPELQVRMRSVRLALMEQVGGDAALTQLLASEGLDPAELGPLLARRARATLYLDRMVATMLTPSDTELRLIHRTTRTPFSAQAYEAVAPLLARWYIGQRLNSAVRAFYEGARSRITVSLAQLPRRPREGED